MRERRMDSAARIPTDFVNRCLAKAAELRVQQENPKTGKSRVRYESYKAARTVNAVLEFGGSKADIANDLQRGYMELVNQPLQTELDNILEGIRSPDYKSRLEKIYRAYNPHKLDQIPSILKRAAGREERLIEKVTAKYCSNSGTVTSKQVGVSVKSTSKSKGNQPRCSSKVKATTGSTTGTDVTEQLFRGCCILVVPLKQISVKRAETLRTKIQQWGGVTPHRIQGGLTHVVDVCTGQGYSVQRQIRLETKYFCLYGIPRGMFTNHGLQDHSRHARMRELHERC